MMFNFLSGASNPAIRSRGMGICIHALRPKSSRTSPKICSQGEGVIARFFLDLEVRTAASRGPRRAPTSGAAPVLAAF